VNECKPLASGSDDGGVLVWDLATAKCVHAFGGHRGRAVQVDPIKPTLKRLIKVLEATI
jgi:WD40 repeat protein